MSLHLNVFGSMKIYCFNYDSYLCLYMTFHMEESKVETKTDNTMPSSFFYKETLTDHCRQGHKSVLCCDGRFLSG